MKVVIAIDSFKGSLTSMEAGGAIKEGILKVQSNADIVIKPLADGGEGTAEALIQGLGGEMIYIDVMGPMGDKVRANYGYIKEGKMAIIEMASAAGIMLVPHRELNPMKATTYGVGEMIKDAVMLGCREFIIGIGGSATNDGGMGMLTALGYEFLNIQGKPVTLGAKGLEEVVFIGTDNLLKELKECKFKVACDVMNPLCGKNGATYIYGPQKGVTQEMRPSLDQNMKHYALVTKEFMQNDYMESQGAGAAGGMGFAFLSYLNAELESGINLVLDAINLEECLKDADYVITGEGRLDHQTVMGKAPIGVAKLAKNYNTTVIALAGSVTDQAYKCNMEGIDAFFPILTQVISLEEAMKSETAKENMARTTEQIFRLINAVQ